MSRGITWSDDLETVMGPKDATTGEAHDDAEVEHESFGTEADDHHNHNQALPEEAQELSNANNVVAAHNNENHNAGSDDDDDMLGSLLK